VYLNDEANEPHWGEPEEPGHESAFATGARSVQKEPIQVQLQYSSNSAACSPSSTPRSSRTREHNRGGAIVEICDYPPSAEVFTKSETNPPRRQNRNTTMASIKRLLFLGLTAWLLASRRSGIRSRRTGHDGCRRICRAVPVGVDGRWMGMHH
jgi:hypothetical protein